MDSDTSGDFVQRVLKASDRLASRPVSQMSSYSSSDLPGRQRSTSRDRVGRLGVRVMQESGALAQKLRCASESRSSRLRQEFLERMSVPQEHGIQRILLCCPVCHAYMKGSVGGKAEVGERGAKAEG